MKRASRYVILISMIGSLLMGVLIAGCSSSEVNQGAVTKTENSEKTGDNKQKKIRYAAFQGMTGLGFWFGKEKGFYDEAGLNLEMVDVQDKVAAFVANEIDFADMNTTQAIIAASKGAPFKIVASMFRTKGAFYLIGNPSISKIEDLKGKRVGVGQFGTGMEVYARVILRKHGLDPEKDVTLIANGSHQQAYASLESGQVDATIIHQPFVALAEERGVGKLLARGWDYLPTFHTGVLVASDDLIQNHPDIVRKLIETYFKANEYAKSNIDELLDFGTKYMRVDRYILKKALESEMEIWENKPELDLKALDDTQNIQIDLGFQDQKYDIEKIIDTRFLPAK